MDDKQTDQEPPGQPAEPAASQEPGWGERRRRHPEPPRADPPTPADDPRPSAGPRPSDPPRPHGDPIFDEPPPPPPPRDYGVPPPPPPPPRQGLDFSALFVLLDAIRRAAPSDLQDRVTSFIREGLLTLRSLIDWYLERLDDRPREPKVEDIPIE